MALDASEGCRRCGFLHPHIINWTLSETDLCWACTFLDVALYPCQTPCGARYCRQCGFLLPINDITNWSDDPETCNACIQIIHSSFVNSPCVCDFCDNRHDQNPTETERQVHVQVQQWKMDTSSSTQKNTSAPSHELSWEQESFVEEEIRAKWESEQLALKKQLVTRDCPRVKRMLQAAQSQASSSETFYVGGVDISFIKGNDVDACAALIVLSFPQLEVVYKRLEMIQLTAPYIPGFLAFREVDSLRDLYAAMMENAPQYKPDVILVDGNGQLHPRGFGLACHLGVVLDTPCVGVAKTLIYYDGIQDNQDHKTRKLTLKKGGETFPLTTDGGETLGVALRSTDSTLNPVYVSVGHKVSLGSAARLTHACCKYRIPEPTRFADMLSRQYLVNGQTDPEEFIA